MRLFILIAFSIICYAPTQAQIDDLNQDKDVLLTEFIDDMADTLKFEIFSDIAESYKFVDLDTTIKYGMLAESVIDAAIYPAK